MSPTTKPGLPSGCLLGIPAEQIRFDMDTLRACRKHHTSPVFGCPVCFVRLLEDHRLAARSIPVIGFLASWYRDKDKVSPNPHFVEAAERLERWLHEYSQADAAPLAHVIDPRASA